MNTNDIEAQAAALTALLEKAIQADPGSDFPEDPAQFDPADIRGWSEVSAALVAYPNGLPQVKKFALLERCKEFTQNGTPNPSLTVLVARMPVIGGFTTKSARRLVRTSVNRKRTGLTRQGSAGISLAARQKSSNVPSMGRISDPNHVVQKELSEETPLSPQQLKLIEQAARVQQQKLDALAIDSRDRPATLVQCRRAWDKLRMALASRSTYLGAHGAPPETVTAYEGAAHQIQKIIDNLS